MHLDELSVNATGIGVSRYKLQTPGVDWTPRLDNQRAKPQKGEETTKQEA